MDTHDVEWQLHDRGTRGEALTPAEQALLAKWYATLDASEIDMLRLIFPPNSVPDLQMRVELVLAQLTTIISRIQEVVAENEALRKENITLRQHIVQMSKRVL
jgi:hypothetical protein